MIDCFMVYRMLDQVVVPSQGLMATKRLRLSVEPVQVCEVSADKVAMALNAALDTSVRIFNVRSLDAIPEFFVATGHKTWKRFLDSVVRAYALDREEGSLVLRMAPKGDRLAFHPDKGAVVVRGRDGEGRPAFLREASEVICN